MMQQKHKTSHFHFAVHNPSSSSHAGPDVLTYHSWRRMSLKKGESEIGCCCSGYNTSIYTTLYSQVAVLTIALDRAKG